MIKAISYIFKRPDLSNQEFINHYETIHAPLARSILEFGYYERNHILNNDSNNVMDVRLPLIEGLLSSGVSDSFVIGSSTFTFLSGVLTSVT